MNEEKDFNRTPYIVIICILSVFIIVTATILFVKLGKFDFILGKKEEKEPENISLKYTDTLSRSEDDIYIIDVSKIVEEAMPSIVAITSKTIISSGGFGPFYSRSYTALGAGSGVIISENENEIFILTNYHVVENSNELSIKFVNDKSYDASVKGVSKRKDIAVISVNKKDIDSETLNEIRIAKLGSSTELKVGNGIIAIGNALGYGQSVTTGVVSALNREITTDEYTQKMIQIDAAINGGNSGGALLNSKGEVVGINSAKYSSNSLTSSSIEGMGFAIPIDEVKEIIENLINGKNDEELSLGIEGYMTNSGSLAGYRLPEGLYVSVINEDGNASNSELEIGNIIFEIDNNKVTSLDTIKKVLNKKNKGDKVTLKVKYASKNEYKEKEIIITLN